MSIKKISIFILVGMMIVSCDREENLADAYGNFEGNPVTVSAEASGKLLQFTVEEGSHLRKGQLVGIVDTTLLFLKRGQLQAGINAIRSKRRNPEPEIEILKEKRRSIMIELKRIEALLKSNAATPKQLDDIKAQVAIIDKKIQSAKESAKIANRGILSGIEPLRAQLKELDEQIARCRIYNPVDGTVLTKLAEESEVTGFGRPLYRIADLSTVILRAYVTGSQLSRIKIGDKVEVVIDTGIDSSESHEGVISWISEVAEFTPKSIQTKEERVNLVYAIKIVVPNDGSLKIGMPAKVYFNGHHQKEGIRK